MGWLEDNSIGIISAVGSGAAFYVLFSVGSVVSPALSPAVGFAIGFALAFAISVQGKA